MLFHSGIAKAIAVVGEAAAELFEPYYDHILLLGPIFLSRSIYLELKVITDDPPLLVLSHHIPMKSHSITIQIP